jgi:hypothetical protein
LLTVVIVGVIVVVLLVVMEVVCGAAEEDLADGQGVVAQLDGCLL